MAGFGFGSFAQIFFDEKGIGVSHLSLFLLLRPSSNRPRRINSAPSSLPLHLLHRGLDPPHLKSSQMDAEKGNHLDAEDSARTQCLRVLPGVQPSCPQMDTKDSALQLCLQVWTPSQQPSPSQFHGTWPSGTSIPVDVTTLSRQPFPCEASIPSKLLQIMATAYIRHEPLEMGVHKRNEVTKVLHRFGLFRGAIFKVIAMELMQIMKECE
ncbi:hypothetical protein MRB53_006234 [Persea americana]|uniref:Uncharacterized protein n=1 Tax=Persea americana TaxID=3435 RepID=A0ACC2MFD1_PERAE|nr:hypothetical protein MRB53_006234 [Persea americana]